MLLAAHVKDSEGVGNQRTVWDVSLAAFAKLTDNPMALKQDKTKTPLTLVGMGSTHLTIAVALPMYGNQNFIQGINEVFNKFN